MERAGLWDAYGCNEDFGELPVREYQAHVAILEGRGQKAREEREKAERAK